MLPCKSAPGLCALGLQSAESALPRITNYCPARASRQDGRMTTVIPTRTCPTRC